MDFLFFYVLYLVSRLIVFEAKPHIISMTETGKR